MENKVTKVIKSRISCKGYSNKKVPLSIVKEVMECGKLAPSGMNLQCANILCVRSKKYVEKLRELAIDLRKKDVYYNASTMILVYGKKDARFLMQDCSCVLENMFIAATALKVGSCWINHSNDILSTPKGLKFRKTLGLAEDDVIVGTCILGYPSESFQFVNKPRKEDFIKIK